MERERCPFVARQYLEDDRTVAVGPDGNGLSAPEGGIPAPEGIGGRPRGKGAEPA